MEGTAEGHIVPVEWRRRYCDAITSGDLLEFNYILQICDDKIFFPIDSAEDCNCWSVPIQGFRVYLETVGYPQCQRLAERVCSGTCDCTNTQYGRLVWFTSLHLACYYGKLEMVKYLMRFCQIATKFQERAFLMPLMVTSLSDTKDVAPSVASLLIEEGSSVDEQDENGFTALHFAVINNNADLVKLYLQRGASINIPAFPSRYILVREKCGLSPLWFAAKFLPSGSHCEELLLAAGANVTDDGRHRCPLFAVCSKEGFGGALRYIRSPGFDINHRYRLFGTHLMNAVFTYSLHEPNDQHRRVWFQVIKHYLEMGVDVNAKNDCGNTALYYSSQNYEILELLISYGADVNHVSDSGYTALMKAFQGWKPIPIGLRSCVRLLLENGANPNAVCEFGWNALIGALLSRYVNISDVKLLLEYNPDLEGLYKCMHGVMLKPLLYYAFDNANFEVAEVVVEYGIDMTKQDWLLDTEHLPNGLRGNDYLYNNLLELYRNPADLKVLVRNYLRRLFGRSLRAASTQLGLPKALENFVTCK